MLVWLSSRRVPCALLRLPHQPPSPCRFLPRSRTVTNIYSATFGSLLAWPSASLDRRTMRGAPTARATTSDRTTPICDTESAGIIRRHGSDLAANVQLIRQCRVRNRRPHHRSGPHPDRRGSSALISRLGKILINESRDSKRDLVFLLVPQESFTTAGADSAV